jgi:glutathione S-transferase
MMRLIGRNLSPYVRRVAIWCALQGRPLERVEQGALDPAFADELAGYHPGLRVPALRLEDGAVLIESFAICDWLDETAPDKRLVPASGIARRDCMQRIALAHATTEKIVAMMYERNRRPEALHWREWLDRIARQVRAGFAALEASAPEAYHGGHAPDGSDIAIVCAYQQAEVTNPWLLDTTGRGLTGLVSRAMTMEPFRATYPEL